MIGCGDCHEELREEFDRHHGQAIYVGQDPFDYGDAKKFFERPDEVWVVRSHQRPQPQIAKNRVLCAPFDEDGARYEG